MVDLDIKSTDNFPVKEFIISFKEDHTFTADAKIFDYLEEKLIDQKRSGTYKLDRSKLRILTHEPKLDELYKIKIIDNRLYMQLEEDIIIFARKNR